MPPHRAKTQFLVGPALLPPPPSFHPNKYRPCPFRNANQQTPTYDWLARRRACSPSAPTTESEKEEFREALREAGTRMHSARSAWVSRRGTPAASIDGAALA